jgi:hypothetical protein
MCKPKHGAGGRARGDGEKLLLWIKNMIMGRHPMYQDWLRMGFDVGQLKILVDPTRTPAAPEDGINWALNLPASQS